MVGTGRRSALIRKQLKRIMEDMPPNIDVVGYETEGNKDRETPGFCQWSTENNGVYVPANNTVGGLPSGLYEIKNDSHRGFYIQHIERVSEELFVLPSPEIKSIIEDIRKFWEGKEIFKNYRYVHKRGILLHGDPGCGKSGIIQLCVNYVIDEMNGIVINIKDHYQVEMFDEFIPTFRKIEPDRPLVVVMEDLDALTGEEKYITSKLLNILDGIKQIEGVVYLASTNYPEKLEERVSDRPSRFDRRYRIEPPDASIRESYLRSKISEEEIKKINLKEWVKVSEGFSIAHLKELVISTLVLGNPFEESLAHLKQLKIKPRNKGNKSGGIGFNRFDD